MDVKFRTTTQTPSSTLAVKGLRFIDYCMLLKEIERNQCNVCPPNNSLSCFYNKGWRMTFLKRIYTPEESFPSRLFSSCTCNYLDKDKKF